MFAIEGKAGKAGFIVMSAKDEGLLFTGASRCSFERSFEVPENVDPDQIEAVFEKQQFQILRRDAPYRLCLVGFPYPGDQELPYDCEHDGPKKKSGNAISESATDNADQNH